MKSNLIGTVQWNSLNLPKSQVGDILFILIKKNSKVKH